MRIEQKCCCGAEFKVWLGSTLSCDQAAEIDKSGIKEWRQAHARCKEGPTWVLAGLELPPEPFTDWIKRKHSNVELTGMQEQWARQVGVIKEDPPPWPGGSGSGHSFMLELWGKWAERG